MVVSFSEEIFMGFNKHKDDIINSLTSGDISDISEVSGHNSDTHFENPDCMQQDTGGGND